MSSNKRTNIIYLYIIQAFKRKKEIVIHHIINFMTVEKSFVTYKSMYIDLFDTVSWRERESLVAVEWREWP